MHLIPCAFLPVLIFPVVLLHSPDILQDCLPVVVCLLPVAFGNGSNNVRITLPNDENKLRALFSNLKLHGQILLVVDQPATIGALPVTVARSEGVLVG